MVKIGGEEQLWAGQCRISVKLHRKLLVYAAILEGFK